MSDLDFERVTHFPIKLWDVVNDESSDIFRWSEDGESFFVDDQKYEKEIMEKYPGFVQISSFANLRRLLREYSFTWQNNETGEFQFSHPGFKRGQRDRIASIRTKRKSLQAANGQFIKARRRTSSDPRGLKSSSKVWLQPSTSGTVNLRVDTLLRFPEKFWAVVNDPNDLLYWGEDGDTVIVDDKKYEDEVMARYPGFVQINSFANLRRLLREYGFSWNIRENGFFEFSHSHMKKGHPELIKGVKTKRKAIKSGAQHPYLPYFKVDNSIQSASFAHPKCFTERLEHIEQRPQSSPEINQAVNAIHHSHYQESMHRGGGDHAVPPNIYGFQPYRLIPPYPPMSHHVGVHPNHSAWPFHGNEKMEPQFYYQWSENQISCDPQSCASQGQMSPDTEAGVPSHVHASSTASSVSDYASSSKGSPVGLDDNMQEHSPCVTPALFQSDTIHNSYASSNNRLFPKGGNGISVQSSQYCDQSLYQSLYHATYPLRNHQNLEPEVQTIETVNRSIKTINDDVISCSSIPQLKRERDDGKIKFEQDELYDNNNNSFKSNEREANSVLVALLDDADASESEDVQTQLAADMENMDDTPLNSECRHISATALQSTRMLNV